MSEPVVRLRTLAERYVYLHALDRSLGLDGGRTEAQERWRRIGPSARALVRRIALHPDPAEGPATASGA